jgi:Tol biopolymer transport system component
LPQPQAIAALCALAVIGGAAFHHAPASSRARDATKELRSTIAFSSTRDNPTSATPFVNGAEICLMNADGSNEVKLTDSPRGDVTPSWSPDGSKIVFHRPKGRGLGLWDLWLVSADESGESRLTDAQGYTGFAHWGMLRARR